jgi:DivIVA domain-containing protein
MSAQPPETGPVTAADVQNIKFQLIRRGGYDPAQVDPFLEVLAETIAGGPNADKRITAGYIHGVRFTTVRRGGYLPTQVDAFLDRVIETFDRLPSPGPLSGSPQPDAAPTVQNSFAAGDTQPAPAAAPIQPQPVSPVATTPRPPTQAPTPDRTPLTPPALVATGDASPEADFDRLRILHTSGVVSDKEFAVLGARVKRRIDAGATIPA